MCRNVKKLKKKKKSQYEINALLSIVFLKKYFNKYFITRRNLNLFFFKKVTKKKVSTLAIKKYLKLKPLKISSLIFNKSFLKTFFKINKFDFFLNFFFNFTTRFKINSLFFFINYDILNLTNFIKHKKVEKKKKKSV